ncbi:chitinase [Gordoniibacillus kamchatkensis]|uniref:chitinase n=1 Tax=Gordoniibacillus kamchatkensis TaxID=1590651 RepID=UPI001E5ECCE9|nr:chitinase [Paenibacillus sp. VKM B-2647]
MGNGQRYSQPKCRYANLAGLRVTTGFNVNWISFSPTPALQNDKWFAAAPYVEVLSSPPDPGSYMSSTGIKGLTLAFILAPNGGGCTPEWDGSDAVATDTTAANYINSVRASGGDAVVSFGGAAGTKLGQTCASAADTANAEQQVINKYSLKAIEWDAEGTDETDAATVSKELGALQILQQNNPSLNISITLPSTPSGLDSNGLNVVQTAVNIGFTPNSWNIMPFDFGTIGTQMGTAAMNASDSLHTQLKGKYSWLSDTQVYHMTGLSLMNGRDDSGEFTYLSDFNNIRNYESSKGMARMTYWDGQRDYQCSPIDPGYTSSTCSGVAQNQWDFTKSIAKFLNSPQGNSSLKAMANGDYVSAGNYGNNPLIANRTTVGTWETFKIYSNADGTVSFLSMINNKFVTADLNQSTKLIAEADVMNTWEKFKQIDNGDGTVSFQSVANNDYVSTDLNFSGVLYANRISIAGWEKFVISSAP